MRTQFDPHPAVPDRSLRVQRVLATIRAAEFRRVRRSMLSRCVVIGVMCGWHLVPRWRMKSLRSEIGRLKTYQKAKGRYPLTAIELEDALPRCGFGGLWRTAEFKGDQLNGMGLVYRPDGGGSGYILHFNHDCFCEPFDTSRYEYWSGDDSWHHWFD